MPPLIVPAIVATTGALISRKGAKEQRAAETRAQEFAAGQTAEAKKEQQRLEEKFGLTPGELEREERTFELEKTRQAEAERRAGLTGEELLSEAGPETRALLDRVASRFGMTGEELFRAEGEIPAALQKQVLAGAREPGGTFEDTLEQQLELVRNEINQEANRRGVFGGKPEGGIRFEDLGRAGVELAIKSAREKQAARQQDLSNAAELASRFQELSQIARGEAGTVGERSIQEQERARTELDQLLGSFQELSASARGRAAEVGLRAPGAAGVPAAQAREAGVVTDIEGLRIGRAAEKERAGLELIGQGVSVATGGLPTPTAGTPPIAPSSFADLTAVTARRDPIAELGSLSGRTGLTRKRRTTV